MPWELKHNAYFCKLCFLSGAKGSSRDYLLFSRNNFWYIRQWLLTPLECSPFLSSLACSPSPGLM